MKNSRIDARFSSLTKENRPALITFITAGDPDYDTSLAILQAMPTAGADIIELGMPFSDPMAEGPAIQASSQRALQHGQTMDRTLEMVRVFRQDNQITPIILMGYYNPIWSYGVDPFLNDAKSAGVDGFIIVDLPPEADDEFCLPALDKGLHFIRLATPTTDDKRLPKVLTNISGFVYYVSVTGITGSALSDTASVTKAVRRIKNHTTLPIAVGFGVKTAEQAAIIGKDADGVVVGSILVDAIAQSLDMEGRASATTVSVVTDKVQDLAKGIQMARQR